MSFPHLPLQTVPTKSPSQSSTYSFHTYRYRVGCCNLSAFTPSTRGAGCAVRTQHHAVFYSDQSLSQLIPQLRPQTQNGYQKQTASKSQTFFTYTYSYSIYTSVTTRGPKKHYGLGPKDSKAQPCDASHLNREAERLPPFHRAVGTQCDLTRPRSNTVTEPRTALRPAAFRWESLSPRPSSILRATRS